MCPIVYSYIKLQLHMYIHCMYIHVRANDSMTDNRSLKVFFTLICSLLITKYKKKCEDILFIKEIS